MSIYVHRSQILTTFPFEAFLPFKLRQKQTKPRCQINNSHLYLYILSDLIYASTSTSHESSNVFLISYMDTRQYHQVIGRSQFTWLTAGGISAVASNVSIFLLEKLLTPMDLVSPIRRHSSMALHTEVKSMGMSSSSVIMAGWPWGLAEIGK